MGSPGFALPILSRLIEQYQIVGVVTQPDRPAGRGRILTPPPVKELALSNNIPCIQPIKLRDPDAIATLYKWHPELIVVAAFGQILRQPVLDLPHFGCINVHASLLPRWRGSAPIQAAILNGDPQTGISIMEMDTGVDTGPILAQSTLDILPEETAESLSERLSLLGAQLLIEVLPGYLEGKVHPSSQVEEFATLAPLLVKEDGRLNFSCSSQSLINRIRAFYPWPGAFMEWQGKTLKIHRAHAISGQRMIPGIRGVQHGLPSVQTLDGLLILDEVQPAAKKSMSGDVFLRGAIHWNQTG